MGAEVVVTNDNFKAEVLDSDIPVLADFWAEWCVPCKMVGPILEQMAEEYKGKVKIAKINQEDQKISLNRKALQESPIDKFASAHRVNEVVKGTIRDIKEFGVFVSIEDGVDALIRNEDLEPLKVEEIEAGQEIEAVIAVIDTRRDRIRLSVKKT